MFYHSLAVQVKWRMRCYKWHWPGLCLVWCQHKKGGGSRTPASCLGWVRTLPTLLLGVGQGTANSLAAEVVTTPRLGLALRQIKFHWWDVRLCSLFIVLLRIGYSSLGVNLHLLYVTWYSFIEVASPGNLCHSLNPGNCPAV